MSASLLLFSAQPLDEARVAPLAALAQAGGAVTIAPDGRCAHLACAAPTTALREQIGQAAWAAKIDFFWREKALDLQHYRLFVSDMDSTLIDMECIDEAAHFHGAGAEVAHITAQAMSGELDFAQSLRARVALLAGLRASALDEILHQRLRFCAGAQKLLAGMRAAGLYRILVSGGFAPFSDYVKTELGFDEVHANTLATQDGVLTGKLCGSLIDAQAKARLLQATAKRLGIDSARSIAVGDGANDVDMIRAAGLGICWHGRKVLRKEADCILDFSGLDSILCLFE